MNNEKITYILGAGASFNAFPLVKDVGEKLGLANALYDLGNEESLYLDEDIDIYTLLVNIGSKSNQFGNVDSYAKYLYHTRQKEELKKLKLALTYFFVSQQIENTNRVDDWRYRNFITSLMTEEDNFPSNVKILNWNYDYLLIKACKMYDYVTESFHETKESFVHQPSSIKYFPAHGNNFQIKNPQYIDNSFSIVHLNGICGFYETENTFSSIFNDISLKGYNEEKIMTSEMFKNRFIELYGNESHLMTFAWEKRSKEHKALLNSYNIAQEIIKDTTILVVIGYSFPFYNREVDNTMMDIMRPTLKKIYYQDPEVNGDFLINRYSLNDYKPRLVPVEHVKYTDQFYVPVEL